ncbi:glutamine amidotransferase [Dokdonella sp.]|uniref:glutamine amidotransferase n=1 Tax=Dokdonella sp. TaxID=2291710 RepID=UPI002636A8B6|nr:glutamine amidotransferase [Dokdonella sp.]
MSFHPAFSRAAGKAALLIVQTGSTLPTLRARHGDFPEWFRRGLGLRRDEVDVVVAERDALPPAGTYAGVVVTGSPAMVSARERWSEDAAAWLRGAIDADVPVLGVCYGHQLLAHALGGRVDYHPAGREIGTVAIETLEAAAGDALLADAPATFPAHSSHQQSVLELPRGATVLARSAHDPHHAVRYAPNAWGLQFHPEFSVEIMQGYIEARRPALVGDCSIDCCNTRCSRPTPLARGLLRRFRAITNRSR